MADIKYCPRCVAQNEDNAKFCMSCGLKFEDMPSHTATEPPTQQTNTEAKPGTGFDDSGSRYFEPQPSMSQFEYTPTGYSVQGKNFISTTVDFYSDPKHVSASVLADPNAPRSYLLVVIRVILEALFVYLLFSSDSYFDFLFREGIEDQIASLKEQDPELYSDWTVSQFRDQATSSFPIMLVIGVVLLWLISSSMMAMIFKGGLAANSPLLHSTGKSMRQLTGYLQLPKIISLLVRILLIFSVNPEIGILLFLVVRILSRIVYAYYLVKGMSGAGYRGRLPATIGGISIATLLFLRL